MQRLSPITPIPDREFDLVRMKLHVSRVFKLILTQFYISVFLSLCFRSFQCKLSATGDPISPVKNIRPGPSGQRGGAPLYAFHRVAGRRPLGALLA